MQKSSTNQDGGQPERSIWGHRVNEASLMLSARRELKVTQTNISTFIKAGLGAASRHVWVVVRFGNKTSLRLNNQMIWCVCHLECETRLCVHFFSHNDSLCCLIVSHHPLLLGLVLSVPLLCHSSRSVSASYGGKDPQTRRFDENERTTRPCFMQQHLLPEQQVQVCAQVCFPGGLTGWIIIQQPTDVTSLDPSASGSKYTSRGFHYWDWSCLRGLPTLPREINWSSHITSLSTFLPSHSPVSYGACVMTPSIQVVLFYILT